MESVLSTLRPGLGIGLLADLIIAWAEGELSEGAMADVTGVDRITLRGLKLEAISRALEYAGPILEAGSRETILESLDKMSSQGREEFFALRPEWRSIYAHHSQGDSSTPEPPPSSP